MNTSEKEIAKLAVNKAEEMCKTIPEFNNLNNETKAIAILFASISILNAAFINISKLLNK